MGMVLNYGSHVDVICGLGSLMYLSVSNRLQVLHTKHLYNFRPDLN